MAILNAGDKVQSLITAQGMHLGHIYEVVAVHEKQLPFGLFVAYDLKDSAGKEINGIQNGHLVLNRIQKAKPTTKNPSCSVCLIETGKITELQRKNDRYECQECGSIF